MKFQEGDKVILIHSGEEAEIVEFIHKEMALVDVNGVRFPVYLDQIDFPYFKRFSAKKNAIEPPKKIYIDQIRAEKKNPTSTSTFTLQEGVWLVFLPIYDKDVFDDDVVDYFRIYLANQSSLSYNFTYWLRLSGEVDFELKNTIPSKSDIYLHDVPFEKLNDSPRFDVEFVLQTADSKKVPHVGSSLKLKAKQIFQKLEEIRVKQEAHFYYLLFEKYPDKPTVENIDLDSLSQAGYKIYTEGKIQRQNISVARSVVDLHIDKIIDSWQHLSNKQILDMQLREFEKYYELALLHQLDRMIVVHGIGKGRLREDIHDLLRVKKEVKSFVNQYHHQFGFGSTEIYFK